MAGPTARRGAAPNRLRMTKTSRHRWTARTRTTRCACCAWPAHGRPRPTRVPPACEPLFTINGRLAIDAEPFAARGDGDRSPGDGCCTHRGRRTSPAHRPGSGANQSSDGGGRTNRRNPRRSSDIANRARHAVSPRATWCVRVNGLRPMPTFGSPAVFRWHLSAARWGSRARVLSATVIELCLAPCTWTPIGHRDNSRFARLSARPTTLAPSSRYQAD